MLTALLFMTTWTYLEPRRLPASAFQALPAAVVRAVDGFGCLVPQPDSYFMAESQADQVNVVAGRFRTDDTEWAVLCSKASRSMLLLCSSSGACDTLSNTPEKNWFQSTGDGQRLVFSRLITKRSLAAGVGRKGSATDSLEDAFLGKASTVLQWRGGRWHRLAGVD